MLPREGQSQPHDGQHMGPVGRGLARVGVCEPVASAVCGAASAELPPRVLPLSLSSSPAES